MPRKKTQDEWDQAGKQVGLEWLDPINGSHKPHRARCTSCDYEWTPYPVNVSTKGTGCPKCGRRRGSKKQRLNPQEHISRADSFGVEWIEVPEVNGEKRPARCLVCSYEWEIKPANLYSGFGCPRCGDRAMAEKQRASQSDRDFQAAAVGLRWLEPVMSHAVPALIECLGCGHQWKARANDVQQGKGCAVCTPSGFNPVAPTILYLLKRKDGIAKIGITNEGESQNDRLRRLRKYGFQEIEIWHFATGKKAKEIESVVLRWWREWLEVGPASSPDEFDGWSETIAINEVSIEEIIAFIEEEISKVASTKERSNT